MLSGRGTVTVGPDGVVTYAPGAPCPCHRELVGRYDPETQVVVVVRPGAEGCIHLVEGWPSPREAWEAAAADVAVQ